MPTLHNRNVRTASRINSVSGKRDVSIIRRKFALRTRSENAPCTTRPWYCRLMSRVRRTRSSVSVRVFFRFIPIFSDTRVDAVCPVVFYDLPNRTLTFRRLLRSRSKIRFRVFFCFYFVRAAETPLATFPW